MTDTPDPATGCPHPHRRSFLRGAALGAAGAAVLGAGALATDRAAATTSSSGGGGGSGSGRRLPFEGVHQSGILTPPQAAATFVSFDAIAPDRASLQDLFRTLTDRIRFLTTGGTPPDVSIASVPSDSATLGPLVPSDGLTVTVGVGSSLFDHRYGLTARKPARLAPMPVFPDDHTVGSTELHGDISLQICADSRDTVMHALRDIAKHTRSGMQLNWKADGFHAAPRPTGTQRNQLGFKDGIANPDTTDPTVTDTLIWTRGGSDNEPAWTDGGSYQVIRIIRMLVEFWDRVSLHEQETMLGRRRDTGAPLDGTSESDIPDYATDPNGLRTPLTAHIRLANPRTTTTNNQQILRRGYNYDRGVDNNGNLDVGLLFCCYQQDVARQFQAVQTRLIGEPLVDYIQPTGGGYFFALPGVRGSNDHLASGLLT
ncbi:iron uptake transporter deferrochelatase/peroxidase subunit [Streptacidiphilus sp. P02-A3a]|uniref:iron uptake transporter deferrochelatase/peroxidase subunit n=1 Tax=Streptacidiphilus sp. P02-A3a TaxID=2704468 RepID=UPI0015FAF825|nr:iron uptake transporter deferrochelatase/peroxidase subunit [Streptacidiphilus sp. P02-A3a]QMU70910.1 deferrochelatase/peroxidase EfeB [Streptacidiphilus sp. P02-A3a]